MSGNGVFYDDEGQPIPRPDRQDPEPEPTPEQEHTKSQAVEFNGRLVFTVLFIRFKSEGAIFGYGLIMLDRIYTGRNLIRIRTPDSRCRFLL